MQKKKLIIFSVLSTLIISAFGLATALAASSETVSKTAPTRVEQIEQKFGITLTDEQKTQIQTKDTEMQAKRAEELAKWQNMTLDTWKAQEIERINATTQDQFDKMKEQHTNMLQNGKGGMGMHMGMEKPAE